MTRPGGKTIGDINADHQVFLDQQPMTIRCAFCPWTYEGTVANGRLEGERHRQAEHPDRAPGGDLAEAFARRRRRRTPWGYDEIVEAFARFEREHGRPARESDIPLVPYLPSMNSVLKAGSWAEFRRKAQESLVERPPGAAAPPPPDRTDAPEKPVRRDPAPSPEPSATVRLRLALHELVDAVIDYVHETR